MKLALCVFLIFVACLSYEVLARDYVESMCYAAMWNSGAAANVKQIYPIKKAKSGGGFYNAVEYYSYGTPWGASINTPDKLEESSVAQYYFFDDDNEVSMFFYFDIYDDPSGGQVQAEITSEGLAGKGVKVVARDDPGDNSYAWDDSDGTSNPDWIWWPCCTDGMALGNLPQPVEKVGGNDPIFNPSDHSFCVNIKFLKDDGVTQYKVQSLSQYFEDGPRNIINFPIPAAQANTLKLCYTQCNCIQNAILDANRGNFDNKAVVEGTGVNSGIGRYAPGSDCSWIIQPEIDPDHVVIYFKEFVFASDADYVAFYSDRAGTNNQNRFPTGNTAAELDWTVPIDTNRRNHPKPEVDLSTYNSFLIPRDGSIFEALVEFHSEPDSKGAVGFTVTYVSVATTDAVTPNQVNVDGNVPVTVTGNYILDAEHLTCKITLSTETIYVDATYIDQNTVSCIVPKKPAAADNDGTISISNDGVQFFNTAPFLYFDATCASLTDCQSCTAAAACGFCAHKTQYNSMSFCESIPSLVDPTNPPVSCNDDTTWDWLPDCCSVCHNLNGCSGHGTCECNQTCTCDTVGGIAYTNASCNCPSPLGPNGQICSGFGTSTCGGCDCNYPHTGATCECLVCPGFVESNCYGAGTCLCNGTCECDPGFDPATSCQCPLSCQLGSNGLECGGPTQGDCECGLCKCKEGFSGATCDCADPSQCSTNNPNLECSGNGVCECDATCSCQAGWTGPACARPEQCFQTSCETCEEAYDNGNSLVDQSFCLWCPLSGKCENQYATTTSTSGQFANNVRVCDTVENNVITNSSLLTADNCPVELVVDDEIIREPDDSLPLVAIIAAIIGLVIALIIGAILAFLGKSQVDGLGNFDFGNDAMGAATSNPLFDSGASQGTSGIYEGR